MSSEKSDRRGKSRRGGRGSDTKASAKRPRRAPSAVSSSRLLADPSESRAERELRLLHTLTQAIATARDLDDAIRNVLEGVREGTGWPLAEAWLVPPGGDALARRLVWCSCGPGTEAFANARAELGFRRGEGLPGRVWATSGPVWIEDLQLDASIHERGLAAQAGLQTAIGIPVMSGTHVTGALTFFVREKRPEDSRLVQIVSAAASQLGIVIDRKRAEDALRESEARFSAIVTVAADAIISIDEQHRITLFNDGAERIFGYQAEEVLGKPLDILLAEQHRTVHREHVQRFGASPSVARRMGERSEIVGRRRSGELFPAEASISKVVVAGRRLYTVVLRDVTVRKRNEEALRFLAEAGSELSASLSLEETIRTLARVSLPMLGDLCAVDLMTEDGTLHRVAALAVDAREDALMQLLRAYPPDLKSEAPAAIAVRESRSVLVPRLTPETRKSIMRDAEHERIAAEIGATTALMVPLLARGRPMGVLTFAMTRSARRFDPRTQQLAEELARRAALALDNARLHELVQRAVTQRDEALGVVSHDMRNPLSVVSMCASSIIEEVGLDGGKVNEFADTIRRAADWMHRIIQDLLDVASIEAGRLSVFREPHTVSEILERATPMLDAMLAEKSQRLDLVTAPDLPPMDVDVDRMLQVISNLVGNAVKFSEPGARVGIRALRADHSVVFAVEDEGPGIGHDQLAHVFDRFWRARTGGRRGAGLGLAIAKGIIEAHGGRIWVESTLGAGSVFYFTIPASDAD